MELLDPNRLAAAIGPLSWHEADGELVKVVRRHDFRAAMQFANEVAELAEAVGHHPDIEIRWDTVTLRLSTHSLGGITDADIALASRIDSIR